MICNNAAQRPFYIVSGYGGQFWQSQILPKSFKNERKEHPLQDPYPVLRGRLIREPSCGKVLNLRLGPTPSADFCRNLRFLQKSKISAEICRKVYISAEIAERCAPFCRNLRFLQFMQEGVHLSAERCTLSADLCRNLRFLQKGVYLSVQIFAGRCAHFLQSGVHTFCRAEREREMYDFCRAERCAPFRRFLQRGIHLSADFCREQRSVCTFPQISAEQRGVHLSAERYTISAEQRGVHLSAERYIPFCRAERCTPFCREVYTFLQKLQKS